jgi:hypothetical protein
MAAAPYRVDPLDPRAPAQEVWDRLTPEEREQIVMSLPSEIESSEPPEGDAHRISKTNALHTLDEYYRRIRRQIYLSAELPVYYPAEAMFAPDLIAVRDVEVHERNSWIVSQERKGIDFALEIRVLGRARKDLEVNVERYARLGISEYFAFDVVTGRLLGWQLPAGGANRYELVVPQAGRWPSRVLELDLAVDEGRLRFYTGSAPLLDARELIDKLSSMVDQAVRRAEEEARRAEEEARRAEDEARRAEDEARRADRLAARLRELGVDPDAVE